VLKSGDLVDRYVVQRCIGRGGAAVVYECRHRVLDTRHALKVLDKSRGAHARLVQEGRLQARLDHPNLLPVRDVLDVDGAPALLMPLVEGPTLRQLLRQHPPKDMESLHLFREIARGVAAIHEAGLVHRDLKPSNILLDLRYGSLTPRIADFGLAQALGGSATPKRVAFVGTPAWAAPEQYTSHETGQPADLWALGMLLATLLLGKHPFAGETLHQLQRRAEDHDYASLTASLEPIPEPWDSLLQHLLQPHPERRPQTGMELLPHLDELPSQKRFLGPGAPLTRAAHRMQVDTGGRASTSDTFHLDASAPEDSGPSSSQQDTTREDRAVPARPFFGRLAEIEAFDTQLAKGTQLFTLVGPGGAGKTHLARHLGRRWARGSLGEAWFCDLSEARTPLGLVVALASGLELDLPGSAPLAQVGRALQGRGPGLVILDNCEQIARETAEALRIWMPLAPETLFIATSRQSLQIPREHRLHVGPFPAPDAQDPASNPAVQLFTRRAQEADSDFVLGPDDAHELLALIDQLDGLPLAIELAAARVGVMGLPRLRARINERIDVLQSRSELHPHRHADLVTLISWSWNLLAPWEQSALAQLSVFDGGFDMDAADAVLDLSTWPDAPLSEDIVLALLDKNMLRPAVSRTRGRIPRFRPYSSVQSFAQDRLGTGAEQRAAMERHGHWFARSGGFDALLSLFVEGGHRRRQGLVADIDNLAAAARRAAERGDADVLAGVIVVLGDVGDRLGVHKLLRELLPAALQLVPTDPDLSVPLLSTLAMVYSRRGQLEEAREVGERAWSLGHLARDGRCQVVASLTIGNLFGREANAEESRAWYLRSRALARQHGDILGLSRAEIHMGHSMITHGDLDKASAHYEEGRRFAAELGSPVLIARSIGRLATLESERGNPQAAEVMYHQAMAQLASIGEAAELSTIRGDLALAFMLQGRFDDARRAYRQCIEDHARAGRRTLRVAAETNLGMLEAQAGRLEEAAAVLERAIVGAEAIGGVAMLGGALATLGEVCARMGDEQAAREHLDRSLGVLTPVGAMPLLVLHHANRGQAELAMGNRAAAQAALQTATELAQPHPPGSEFQQAVARLRVAVEG
jgi:serine/threonine protein kinase/predicted ATPase/tetratricopeptide (TPR) repeat protein